MGNTHRGELWDGGALREASRDDYRRDSDTGGHPGERRAR